MRYSTQIKPISYLKANAADVLDKLQEDRQPLIITQNGEAKAVLQDLATYENTQETLALLKILALGMQQIDDGKIVSAKAAFARARTRLSAIAPAPAATRSKAKAAANTGAKPRVR